MASANVRFLKSTNEIFLPHDITCMVVEIHDFDSSINVPEHAAHVTTGGKDLAVVQEAAARKIPRVCAQLSCHLGGALASTQIVNRAHVVKSTTCDKVASWGIGTCHDPRRSQRDGIDLVGGICVPDNQLSILRGRDKVAFVC